MKKLSMLLSLVMVLALAAPAFAGINTDISGSLSADLRYDGQDGLTAEAETKASVKMSAGSEDGNIKAVVNLGTTTTNPKGAFGGNSSPFIGTKDIALNITSAWIETTGAWIKGGPAVTTKIGSLAPSYNNWVADLSNDTYKRVDAVEVSGLDLGAVSLTGLLGWYDNDTTAATDTHKLSAISASGGLDVVDLGFVYVSEKDAADAVVSTDYAVTAGVSPVDGVSVDATFASHGASTTTAYKVGGELSTIPDVTLSASTWSAAAGFDPAWANHKDDDLTKETTAFTADQKGYKVAAETTQSGVDLGASYESTTDAAGGNAKTTTIVSAGTTVSETELSGKVTMETGADTKIEVSASRSFGNVNGSYKLTSQGANMDHEIAADTTVNTPLADETKLAGKVILDGSDTNFGFDATWAAPNGINLGIGYANYDREDDWPGDYDVTGDANGADGFTVHAGIDVSF